MVYRKSLVQVKFRLRQDILRKLEREAKRHDRSTNDEIARRLERSFDYDDWREERLILITALKSHPALTPQERAAVERHETADEKDFQEHDLPDIMIPTTGSKR
jgi:Arc-like DNA binding domain